MREAINNNPKVQAALVVGLLLAGVLLFMMMSKKEPVPPAGDAAAASAASAGVAVTGSGAGAVPAGTSADPAATAAAAGTATGVPPVPTAATGTVSPEALIPGPGLPADLAQAWARGNAVVLLIVKQGSTDDDLVRDSVDELAAPGVSVFVAPASKVARYSRITQGVGVNRVPALIVIRPRRLSGDVPEAAVSYGFRNKQSVVQAVEDALYTGRDDVPYHPG
jgi:hypothetical protein